MKLNSIFISNGKNYFSAYYTVEKWLNDEMNKSDGFSWENCSTPNGFEENCSFDITDKIFMNKTKNQLELSSIFIVISDMYNVNKKLMDFEITTAKQSCKYIIALKRWRNLKPVPKMILKNADEIVNLCNTDLVNAINIYFKSTLDKQNYHYNK